MGDLGLQIKVKKVKPTEATYLKMNLIPLISGGYICSRDPRAALSKFPYTVHKKYVSNPVSYTKYCISKLISLSYEFRGYALVQHYVRCCLRLLDKYNLKAFDVTSVYKETSYSFQRDIS